MTKYLLVNEPTGVSAEELGKRVGMRAYDTPLGTMLEKPPSMDGFYRAMAQLDRALHPDQCNCGAIIAFHAKSCPQYGRGVT